MPNQRPDLASRLPDPIALLTSTGAIIEANPAYLALASALRESAGFSDLFGASAAGLLEEASRGNAVCGVLQLDAAAAPNRWFRVSLAGHSDGSIVALLTPADEQIGWRTRVEERDRDLEALKNIGTALSGTVELEELIERVYGETRRIIDGRNFYLALYDRDAEVVSFPRYIEEGQWHELKSRPFAKGLTEHVLATGAPLLINRDVVERCRELGIEPQGRPCRAWIGVPMVTDGETVGAIALQDYDRDDVYDSYDVEVLSVIASQAAAAIKTARVLAAARHAYEELSETQARLLETERVRGVTEAVGAMNHEVNNPLAAITGNAQLLLRRTDSLSPDVRLKIECILEAAKRIERVTSKMSTLIQATAMPYTGYGAISELQQAMMRADSLERLANTGGGSTPSS